MLRARADAASEAAHVYGDDAELIAAAERELGVERAAAVADAGRRLDRTEAVALALRTAEAALGVERGA